MPTYVVTRNFMGSASYTVVAESEQEALKEADYIDERETLEDFYTRLSLDYIDYDVYEEKED